jgi:RHS repeat-associated protein
MNFCWAYDSFGNRTQQSTSNAAFTTGENGACNTTGSLASPLNTWASYNRQNQVTGTTAAPGGYAYDGAGDVVNDGKNAYLYDAEGRICAVTNGDGWTGYLYDAAGNRVAKGSITNPNGTCDIATNGFTPDTGYVVGPSGEQLTEVDGSGNWVHTNVYAGGKLIATYDGDVNASTLHFHFDDPLGTRRAQTDATGLVEATYQSLPFGDGFAASGIAYDPTENHFTGKERDTESGNDYFGARYFGSSMGRFLSPDPLGGSLANPQSLNHYAYAFNNPLKFIDPTGMYVCDDSENCDSDQDKKFSMALSNAQADVFKMQIEKGLGSNEVEDAQEAINSYGDEGVDNGVDVKFDSNAKVGETYVDGITGAKTKDNPTGQNILVVLPYNSDSGLVSHEGVHVAHGEAWVASGFSTGKNPTRFQDEIDAYHVQYNIMQTEMQGLTGSLGPEIFTRGESFRDFLPDLRDFLKSDPHYSLTPASKERAFCKGCSVVPQ